MIDTPYVLSMCFEKAVKAKPNAHDTGNLFYIRIIIMRDIKFRTYVRFLREMHEVREMILDKGTVMIDAYQYGLDKDDAPVMQFTGLQDKKGNDIYEDDICTVAGIGLAIVEMCPYNGTQFKTLDGYDVPVIDCVAEDDDFEIVGNIHQNPELLEGDR